MAGEAGIQLLVDIAKKVIEPAVDAIVLHFGYLIHYESNVKNLKQRAEELQSTKADAENFFNSSGDNNEETTHTNTLWLNRIKAAENAANAIKEAIENPKTRCLSKWCPNPVKRYQLSRDAVKEAEEIRQLQTQGSAYVSTTNRALPPSKLIGALANRSSNDFESRAKIMDEIMKALKDDKISIIGVCGTGGIGKTTLMHELREMAKLDDLFHEVAMATVSQNPDMSNIQLKLAEMLGLVRVKDGKNEIVIADELRKRLTGKGRRTLVILDDIWNEINLEKLGIPVKSDQTECKVVITTRQQDICARMNAQKTISISILTPEEAWYLFIKTAGDCVEHGDLKEIAKEVAGECGGLPIALVTLAKALSNKKIAIWKDALKQLKEHSVTRIPEMNKYVYSSIKMSYDFLANEQPEAKPLLLLCCQHPEDAAIEVEKLAMYCLALRLLNNVDTLEGVRNSICTLIDYLKSCFLLEVIDVEDNNLDQGYGSVKMHDVIRDVGLSIISEVKEERDRVSMHIVEQVTDDNYMLGTSDAADYPNLKILLCSVYSGFLNKSIFSRMEELRVLECLCSRYSGYPLPPLDVLTNLRILSLDDAMLDEDTLSKIGRLTKLESLRFPSCKIGPFPRQIRQLSNLKLLDLRCFSIESHPIPKGILPELNKLEELYLGSYQFWGTPEDDKEGTQGKSYGRIAELNALVKLTALQVELLNSMELLDIHFCLDKLQIFALNSVKVGNWYSKRSLNFEAKSMEWLLAGKFESIVKRTEKLGLIGLDDWSDPLKLEKFVSLRGLKLYNCEQLEYLIRDVVGESGVFRKLDYLSLQRMSGLTELCHNGNLPTGSLGKLRRLYLYDLPKMRHLWVGATDPLCLVNLREVLINNCGALECIFPHSAAKSLVQLETLHVEACGMLEGIVAKGDHETARGRGGEDPTHLILHFPKLRIVHIGMLPLSEGSSNLRGFYNHADVDDNSRLQPLFNPLVMIPSMERLWVDGLHQLKQIVGCGTVNIPEFTPSNWLQNLQQIGATSCESLETVFDFEGIRFMPENAHVPLGNFQEIALYDLPNLTHIFRGRMQDISIPALVSIRVDKCHKLGNLFASNLIKLLHNLRQVMLARCKSIESVFDFEGLEVMGEDERTILSELHDIELSELPKLEHLCTLAPKDIHLFQNLGRLDVVNCRSLTYLFSSSIARMLEKLEILSIQWCTSIKECISMNEECVKKKIAFRSLRSIVLKDLEKLSSFCSCEQLEFEFPSLEDVSISCCPEMKTFCYRCRTAEKLHGVKFESGDKPAWKVDPNQTIHNFNTSQMESYQKDDDDSDRRRGGEIIEDPTDLILHFPKLISVHIEDSSSFRGFYNHADVDDNSRVRPLFNPLVMLPSMEKLWVDGLHQLKQIVGCGTVNIPEFTPANWLQNLQRIGATSCDSLETVFDFEGLEVMGEDERTMLSELRDIELSKLPKLEHLCTLAPKDIHLFQNLGRLYVVDCGRLSYLFSSSIARMLEKLEILNIEKCNSIKECISSMNEECVKKKIVFRSLRSIVLEDLEKLSSFCSSEQLEFEFPSLEDVSISCCPEMMTFCYGCLTAEKLHGVKFESADKPAWKIDLNQTIQHFNTSYQKDDDSDDGLRDESIPCGNEVLDHSGTRSSTQVEQRTSLKPKEGLLDPPIEPFPSSISESNNELAYSTSPDLIASVPSASIEQSSLPSSDMKEVDSAAAEDDETVLNNINVSKDGDENVQSDNGVLDHSNVLHPEIATSEGMENHGTSILSKSFVEFREFTIIVNGCIIDSELSKNLQAKYYELCCARKSYLHLRLLKSINHKLAAEIISETINIADAIRASKLSTSFDQFANWDKTLEAFELLGMDVGFLRARLKRLVTFELKLLELNEARSRLEKEMESLKDNAKQYEIMFQEEANAVW